MAVKLLISGISNAGKTTLIKDMPNTLLLSHDGKRPAVKIPFYYAEAFGTSAQLINKFNEKIELYKEKLGDYPKNIAIDSLSRIYDSLYDYCNLKFTGFTVYGNLDKEIKEFNDYVETTLVGSGFNVILISHATYDTETSSYSLIGKGSYAKMGGALSTVEEAIFIEPKNNKRIVHFRGTKFPARTLLESQVDSMDVSEFNLNDYMQLLIESQADTDSYEL